MWRTLPPVSHQPKPTVAAPCGRIRGLRAPQSAPSSPRSCISPDQPQETRELQTSDQLQGPGCRLASVSRPRLQSLSCGQRTSLTVHIGGRPDEFSLTFTCPPAVSAMAGTKQVLSHRRMNELKEERILKINEKQPLWRTFFGRRYRG